MSSKILEATPSNSFGPYYVRDAPFRGKLSPVYDYGKTLIIKGTVKNIKDEPLPFVNLDVWQANMEGKFDYYEKEGSSNVEGELNEGESHSYNYRVRLITNEEGEYEFETFKPPPYVDEKINQEDKEMIYRTPHIHFFVRSENYKPLVTQLFFDDEEKNAEDKNFNEKCSIPLLEKEINHTSFYLGVFDIILTELSPEELRSQSLNDEREFEIGNEKVEGNKDCDEKKKTDKNKDEKKKKKKRDKKESGKEKDEKKKDKKKKDEKKKGDKKKDRSKDEKKNKGDDKKKEDKKKDKKDEKKDEKNKDDKKKDEKKENNKKEKKDKKEDKKKDNKKDEKKKDEKKKDDKKKVKSKKDDKKKEEKKKDDKKKVEKKDKDNKKDEKKKGKKKAGKKDKEKKGKKGPELSEKDRKIENNAVVDPEKMDIDESPKSNSTSSNNNNNNVPNSAPPTTTLGFKIVPSNTVYSPIEVHKK